MYASEEEPALSEADRRQGEERLRRLLVGAPADRAWRRRGCMVLCRNRILTSGKPKGTAEDMCLVEREDAREGQEDEQQRRRWCFDSAGKCPAAKVARVSEGDGGIDEGGLGRSGSATIADAAVAVPAQYRPDRVEVEDQEDRSDRDDFSGVCFRLVELAEEIFREVVGFL